MDFVEYNKKMIKFSKHNRNSRKLLRRAKPDKKSESYLAEVSPYPQGTVFGNPVDPEKVREFYNFSWKYSN